MSHIRLDKLLTRVAVRKGKANGAGDWVDILPNSELGAIYCCRLCRTDTYKFWTNEYYFLDIHCAEHLKQYGLLAFI